MDRGWQAYGQNQHTTSSQRGDGCVRREGTTGPKRRTGPTRAQPVVIKKHAAAQAGGGIVAEHFRSLRVQSLRAIAAMSRIRRSGKIRRGGGGLGHRAARPDRERISFRTSDTGKRDSCCFSGNGGWGRRRTRPTRRGATPSAYGGQLYFGVFVVAVDDHSAWSALVGVL